MAQNTVIPDTEYRARFLAAIQMSDDCSAPLSAAFEKVENDLQREYGRRRYTSYASFASARARKRRERKK